MAMSNEEKSVRRRAGLILRNAVNAGRVVKPTSCSRCPGPGVRLTGHNLQAHHHDYSKPLDIVWLCSACHTAEHAKLSAEERGLQMNIWMKRALFDELTDDAEEMTKMTGIKTTRQDMLKLAHRAWKNLKANATKKEGK
jgi:formate-dependent nitrite reductase cytochrome c552 subunit